MFQKLRVSMANARRGFRMALAEEPNLRTHISIALIVVALSVFLEISKTEWFAVIFAITLVICLEMVNSIFERAIDMIKPTVNDYVKDMKDMMAASVLIAALAAVIVGVIVFLPKLLAYWPL